MNGILHALLLVLYITMGVWLGGTVVTIDVMSNCAHTGTWDYSSKVLDPQQGGITCATIVKEKK